MGHWNTKKITNFQNILKKHRSGELQNKVQFCTRRSKSHFFLTHPVYISEVCIRCFSKKMDRDEDSRDLRRKTNSKTELDVNKKQV